MKPTILCGECQQPVAPGSKFCSHCGKPVEWSDEGGEFVNKPSSPLECNRCGAENDPANKMCVACGEALEAVRTPQAGSRQKKEAQATRRKNQGQPLTLSWKTIAGFVVFLGVGVYGLELLTAKRLDEIPHTHDEATQPAAADMQALQQIEEMERSLEANPTDQSLRIRLANLLHDARFYDKAIQRYNEYLRQKPDDVDARVDLGICYYEIDRSDEARQQMLKALEYDPEHLLGHFNLGIVNLRIAQAAMSAGETDKANAAVREANDWFRKTVALDPNGSAGERAERFLADHSNQQNLLTN